MPFTSLSKIQSLLPASILEVLQDSQIFRAVEQAAAEIISSETGLAIPSNPALSPAWVHFPAALLIKKIAAVYISTKSEEYMSELVSDYDMAIRILRQHRVAGDLSLAKCSSIAEVSDVV